MLYPSLRWGVDMDVSQCPIDLKLSQAEPRRLERLVQDGNMVQKFMSRARLTPLSDSTQLNGTIGCRDVVSLPIVHR
jgi:hypothetical protein